MRRDAFPVPQLLGGIPPGYVVTYTGTDYYGSFLAHFGGKRQKKKVWRVIFPCLTSRAVHLYLVDSLSMDACVNAIDRFLSQNGDVTCAIYSDNGTNFIGSAKAFLGMYTWNVHQKYKRHYPPRKIMRFLTLRSQTHKRARASS